MPAHIGLVDSLRYGVGYLDQKTQVTRKGWQISQHCKVEGFSHAGIADVARLAQDRRSRREQDCPDFAAYRTAMNNLDPKGKAGADLFTVRKFTRDVKQVDTNPNEGQLKWFRNEWDLYLKPGTAFDQIVQGFFHSGWTVTLIMHKAPRAKQLKRIEGTKPGARFPKLLWSSW